MSSMINTNLASMNAQRNLSASQSGLSTSLQRLSSGLRINSAKDDAAGLGIATRMTSQINGNNVAIRNANDGISLAQTADGALSTINDNLQRMRDLAVQSNSATMSTTDKATLDSEFGSLAQEVQRVAGSTTFNGQHILAADAGAISFQVGAGTTTDDSIAITTNKVNADTDVVAVAGSDNAATGRAVLTGNATATNTVIDNIDKALGKIKDERSLYGATQNRFASVVSNLQTSVESQTAAKSRIMDADFAAETANLSRGQILQQAGTAMLAQANSIPSGVMALLRG
jgi:flagellin